MKGVLKEWEDVKHLFEELECINAIERIDWKNGDINIYVSYNGYDAVDKAFQIHALGWNYTDSRLQKIAINGTRVSVLFV